MYGRVDRPFFSVGLGVQPPSWPMIDLTQLQGNPNSQWNPSVECDGRELCRGVQRPIREGTRSSQPPEFGFFFNKWLGSGRLDVSSRRRKCGAATSRWVEPAFCAEASGAGSRRNALIGGTNWTVNGFLGDPVVGLHAH
jgi:hypothetical protein